MYGTDDMTYFLQREEYNGMVLSNRFRYLISGVIALAVILISGNNPEWLIPNTVITFAYLTVTFFQSLLLKKTSHRRILSIFNVFMILSDYAIFLGITVYYWQLYAPENPTMYMKNNTVIMLLIPVVITTIQFHWRWIVMSGILFYIIYGILFFLVIDNPQYVTDNWVTHSFTDKVFPQALLIFPFVALAVISLSIFSVIRISRLIRNIGGLERQRTMLSRYFSPSVVGEISEGNEDLEHGRKQQVTILFSDIRNFTAMSETMAPEEMAELLTDYRERMVQTVFDNDGTVDKFIGDAVMATFGTPRPSDEPKRDARNAYACAVAMEKALAEFNEHHGFEGEKAWRFGIGLHCGQVFVGTIGRKTTLEYTVIGDAVNTASRIEALCKEYHATLLLSADVMNQLDAQGLERIGEIAIRGKTAPLIVYAG